MNNIIQDIIRANKTEEFTKDFLTAFLEPSYGAISKTEIDNQVFTSLVKCGAIDSKSQVYDIARQLNVTPSKARNLLFQYQIRQSKDDNTLRQEISETFRGMRFHKDGDYISFGVESPILREEIKSSFKKIKFFPDGSFSSEIIRVPIDGLVEFIDTFLSEEEERDLLAVLKTGNHIPDDSLKNIAKTVLKKLGKAALSEVGEQLAERTVDHVYDLGTNFIQSLMTADTETLRDIIPDLSEVAFT